MRQHYMERMHYYIEHSSTNYIQCKVGLWHFVCIFGHCSLTRLLSKEQPYILKLLKTCISCQQSLVTLFFNSLLFQNGLKEIRRIQQFFGYSHSDEHLLEILERCSLNHLRDNAESGRAKNLLVKEGKAFIFRKGNVIDLS